MATDINSRALGQKPNPSLDLQAMERELQALIKVSACVAASASYARFASSSTKPGKIRLLALLPVVFLLPSLPWCFSSLHLRAISAFFLAWLAVFKLLLLAFGQPGPLSPSLPLPTFVAISSLPVKIRPDNNNNNNKSPQFSFVPFCTKSLLLACMISLYKHRFHLHRWLQLSMYSVHLYLALDVVLASAAFFARSFLGLDLEPQFNAPFKSTTLQDFWGRRWNLMVTGILRPSVYHPVRSRLGITAGVVAVFLVSGLMHEVMFYYMTMEGPTGEVTAFFLIHGLCTVAEVRARMAGIWAPRPAVAVALTLGFVASTGFWLFFPPALRGGVEEKTIEECEVMLGSLQEGGRAIFRWLR